MSKKKRRKDNYCCCECCDPCNCCNCCDCCYDDCCCGSNNNNGMGCGILEAIIFWLIACGAGLLNTNSILIILLLLLYGWSCGSCGFDGFGW